MPAQKPWEWSRCRDGCTDDLLRPSLGGREYEFRSEPQLQSPLKDGSTWPGGGAQGVNWVQRLKHCPPSARCTVVSVLLLTGFLVGDWLISQWWAYFPPQTPSHFYVKAKQDKPYKPTAEHLKPFNEHQHRTGVYWLAHVSRAVRPHPARRRQWSQKPQKKGNSFPLTWPPKNPS